MSRRQLQLLHSISLGGLLAVLAMMLIQAVIGALRLHGAMISGYPWWRALTVAAIYYALPVLVLVVITLHCRHRLKIRK